MSNASSFSWPLSHRQPLPELPLLVSSWIIPWLWPPSIQKVVNPFLGESWSFLIPAISPVGPDLALMGNVLAGACLPSHPPPNTFSLIPCSTSCLFWVEKIVPSYGKVAPAEGRVLCFPAVATFTENPAPNLGIELPSVCFCWFWISL